MIKTLNLVLDLLKVYLYVKLESSNCIKLLLFFYKAQSIEARADYFSAKFSNLARARVMCRVLCFALNIKGKTLATFWGCCLCCVCESLVRSRGVSLHIYLGLSRIKIMSRAWWSVRLLHKELKDTQVGVLVRSVNPRKK